MLQLQPILLLSLIVALISDFDRAKVNGFQPQLFPSRKATKSTLNQQHNKLTTRSTSTQKSAFNGRPFKPMESFHSKFPSASQRYSSSLLSSNDSQGGYENEILDAMPSMRRDFLRKASIIGSRISLPQQAYQKTGRRLQTLKMPSSRVYPHRQSNCKMGCWKVASWKIYSVLRPTDWRLLKYTTHLTSPESGIPFLWGLTLKLPVGFPSLVATEPTRPQRMRWDKQMH